STLQVSGLLVGKLLASSRRVLALTQENQVPHSIHKFLTINSTECRLPKTTRLRVLREDMLDRTHMKVVRMIQLTGHDFSPNQQVFRVTCAVEILSFAGLDDELRIEFYAIQDIPWII